MNELPLVWRKCNHWVKYGGEVRISQVLLNIETGSAYILEDGKYYWIPIYKECCTFAHDENFTDIIDTRNKFPHIKV